MSIRTDLAVEANEMSVKNGTDNKSGVSVEEENIKGFKTTKVKILNKEGEKSLGKPIGTYITINIEESVHHNSYQMDEISKALGSILSSIFNTDKINNTLVVGLGNWNITPDSLGPKVVEKIMVTRHLKELVPESIDDEIRSVSAISPGVLGLTGIETSEIIKGIVEKSKPELIVCIDALAARDIERVNATIQITNTGISPGAGVGNKRAELSEKKLGVPVIAIGVPTVVDAATIASDTIDLILDELIKSTKSNSEFYEILKDMDRGEKDSLIQEVLTPSGKNFMATPKDVDSIMVSLSKIIANGINIFLQPKLDLEDINMFLC